MPRLPDQVDAPMTPRQLATLRTLSAEAYGVGGSGSDVRECNGRGCEGELRVPKAAIRIH